MSMGSRAMCGLYIATALWLAWCAVRQYQYGALWAACLFAAASVVVVIGVVRETVLAEERRTIAALQQRSVRDAFNAEPRPADGTPLNAGEQEAWQEIAGHWDDREAA